MNPQAEFEALLKHHKFELVSQNKHLKYQDPFGRVLVVSKTPSDWRAYRNQVSVIKRVVAAPPPSSTVIEAERQAKELEQFITLEKQRKKTAGAGGGGPKTKGTGYRYIDKAKPFVPDEVREAARQEARQEAEWSKTIHGLKRERVKVEEELDLLYIHCFRFMAARSVRVRIASTVHQIRTGGTAEVGKAAAEAMATQESRQLAAMWVLDSYYKSALPAGTVGPILLSRILGDRSKDVKFRYHTGLHETDRALFAYVHLDAANMAALAWARTESEKPGWLSEAVAVLASDPLEPSMAAAVVNMRRLVRVGYLYGPFEGIVAALDQAPRALRTPVETEEKTEAEEAVEAMA